MIKIEMPTDYLFNNESSPAFSFELVSFLREIMNKAISEKGESFREQIRSLETCTWVFHACGTCENDGSRVDWYCGGGGPEPDFTHCEPC